MKPSSEIVTLELLPGQREMINCPVKDVQMDICCYQGGYGSGKTRGGVELGLLLAEKYRGVPGLVGGMTWPLVRDTTLQTYFETFDDRNYVEGRDYKYSASKKMLIFPKWGNSAILFRSFDNPNKLKSLNLGWVHMEEMSESPESVFLMLLSRLRHRWMKRYRLFGTTNPQANRGWIYEYFQKGAGLIEKEVNDEIIKINYRRIIAPSTQNVHLSAANLVNMKEKFDEEYYRINVLGQDGDYNAGLVIRDWSDLNEVECDYRPELRLHITCDFNIDPNCWILAHHTGTGPGNYEFFFFDEVIGEKKTTLECVDMFAKRYPPEMVKNGIEINGDASGSQHRTEAQQYNHTNYNIMLNRLDELGYKDVRLNVRSANPQIVDRVAAFNGAVCNKSGVRRVFVNKNRCKWFYYNIMNLMYKEGRKEIKEPTDHEIKHDPKAKFLVHPFDAGSYLVEKYDPVVLKVKKDYQGSAPEVIFDV